MNKLWHSITRPPYAAVPWLLVLYVILCVLLVRHGGIFTGHLVGYDDQVRMTQVLNWINGAGWYDRTIMRANPPEGFTTIWTRIVDIPIAAVVVLAQQFVPQKTAALVAAFVVPLIEFAILVAFAAPYFVRPLVGKNKANLIGLFLILTSIMNVKFFSASGFLVGEASHHPWYIILNLTMGGAVARLVMGSRSLSPIFVLGISIALQTAVGIECYPLIAADIALLAITAWSFNGWRLAKRGADAVLGAALGSLALLFVHQPPSHILNVSFAEPSIVGPTLILAAGLFLKVEQLLLTKFKKNKEVSLIGLIIVAATFSAILIFIFPQILDGPAAGLSIAERKMALSQHYEAMSVYKDSTSIWDFINLIMPTCMALTGGLFALYYAKGRKRAMYFCYFGFAAFGGAMSEIFARYYHHAMTAACAWLLWIWEEAKKKWRKSKYPTFAAWISFIVLGPLWMLFLPVMERQGPIIMHILLFPAEIQWSDNACNVVPIAQYINSHYDKNTLLNVPTWTSEEFLYQTDVRIDFVSNYPSHDKFIDNLNFFGTQIPMFAKMIAQIHGFDLVAVCKYPNFYETEPRQNWPFTAYLQAGEAPSWLKLVDTGLNDNYMLYEVDKKALKEGNK